MLAHDKGVAHAAAWQAWEASHEGRAVVLVHLKAGVDLAPSAAGNEWLASGRQLHTRVASQWGDISLTQAVLGSAAEMLRRCPRLQHIAVVSGQDVPVAALPLPLPPGVSVIGCFQFGREYDAAARCVAAGVLTQQLGMGGAEAGAWGDSLTFHHTWLVLSRQLLLALLSKQGDIMAVGAALQPRFMQRDAAVAADEYLLVTAAVRYGFVKEIQRRSIPTFIRADRERRRAGAGSMSTRSAAAAAARRAAAAAAAARVKEDAVVGCGVLLDCCPTLALFHPTHTRHPHTWRNFTAALLCDVHAADDDGSGSGTKLSLLQALGLAKPNWAWFFRKVEVKRQAAQGTLLQLLQLLWQDKPLPRNLAALG
ncbi:hypothetical protein OEZ85_010673 [Tetradesmus obliquus]|uniref:Uncharacterized protein n=1 Tax=Tetradesmus obliquus TaxID=3088 RepID=A0ABY8TN05_TETOB|nr:hypothetical protein OEZ85_010673 [Tetradesmus obliquus]